MKYIGRILGWILLGINICMAGFFFGGGGVIADLCI